MKTGPPLFLAGLAALAAVRPADPIVAPPPPPRAAAYFAPGTGPRTALEVELGRARKTVLVQAYGFTSRPIADALIAARGRGVAVRVVVDRSNRTARGSQAVRCALAGVPVLYDGRHRIAHNKVVVIDDDTVITGSYNFTASAESNAENLLVLIDRRLAAAYTENWHHHADHSADR